MNHNEPYSAEYLKDILSSVKTIAMVGASPDKTKFSYGVLRVLHETGYDMIPVNPKPGIKEIRNLKVYPNLSAIDRPVDMLKYLENLRIFMELLKRQYQLEQKYYGDKSVLLIMMQQKLLKMQV